VMGVRERFELRVFGGERQGFQPGHKP
jgi:hypothetical protein